MLANGASRVTTKMNLYVCFVTIIVGRIILTPTVVCIFSQIDIVSGTVGLKMVCVTLQEFTVTSDVSGDKWLKLLVTEMGCYNKYKKKQYTHAQTHLHTH